jgi:alpha-galactosidase/6-phospho-beta-glucosidase family protein
VVRDVRGPANLPQSAELRGLADALGVLPSPYLKYYVRDDEPDDSADSTTRAEVVQRMNVVICEALDHGDTREYDRRLRSRGGHHLAPVVARVVGSLSGVGSPAVATLCIPRVLEVAGEMVECALETTSIVSTTGATPVESPIAVGLLPMWVPIALCESSVATAALNGDRDLLRAVASVHPLIKTASLPLPFDLHSCSPRYGH